MKQYKVVVTKNAGSDVEGIIQYIAQQDGNANIALQIAHRLKQAMYSLREMPERHRVLKTSYITAITNIRFLPVDRFLLFYSIDEQADTVSIIRVFHMRQNWENMLYIT